MTIGCLEAPKPSYPPFFDQLSERYQPLFEGKKLRRFPFFFQIFCCEKMWVGPKLALLQEDQLPMSFKSDQRFNFPPLTTMAIGMDLFHLKPARPTDIWFIAFLTQQRNSEKCQKAITVFHMWQEHGLREKKCFTVDLFSTAGALVVITV